jgi:hypothetical protein
MYYPERPLSHSDIKAIAKYLKGKDEDLEIALSELGLDPCSYNEYEMRNWLKKEASLVQCPDTGIWHRIKS